MRIQHLLILGSTVLLAASLAGCNDESTAAENNSKVFKASNAIQCEPGSGTSLDEAQMELVDAGIDVVCAQTAGDGLIRAAVCGIEVGIINVLEIRTVNLQDAEALGYASVMTLPDYQDRVCQR